MTEDTPTISSYRQLIVWQKSVALATHIYSLTRNFPQEERYGLLSQMRRAAVSIPSNIAEGRSRNSRKDFIQFLHIALGSVAELETQLEIAMQILYVKKVDYNEVMAHTMALKRMLFKMLSSLKAKSQKL